MQLFSLIFFIIFSLRAHDSFIQYTLCRNGSEVRALRIQKISGDRFQATYTKSGDAQVIAEATSIGICEEAIERTKNNIEEAGWTCRQIRTATHSSVVSEEANE